MRSYACLLFDHQGCEPVKVEDKVLARCINVLDDRIHPSHLGRSSEGYDAIGEWLAARRQFQLHQGCPVTLGLFQELLLNVLGDHGCILLAPSLVSQDNPERLLTHGDVVFYASGHNDVC